MRVGVLGGTFDPPHKGHLEIARAALDTLELDEVLFLPASRNPMKTGPRITPGKHRLAMVQALIEGEDKMACCDLEVVKGGASYTVETMTELNVAQPADYWFLLGGDALKTLPTWKQPGRLLRLCRLGVALRAPLTEDELLSRVPAEYKEHIDILAMRPSDVSSSDLRTRLVQGLVPGPNLPEKVYDYIKQNRLYHL